MTALRADGGGSPSRPGSRTVLAVQGSLRRAKNQRAPWTAPGRSEDCTERREREQMQRAVSAALGLTSRWSVPSRSVPQPSSENKCVSCQVCWRTIEMGQRSIRRFLNLISVEAL
jgi:hypothetical protein